MKRSVAVGARCALVLIAALATITASSAAHAGAAPVIVIESHAGPRPEGADAVIAPVLDYLRGRGYLVDASELGTEYERVVSRPGVVGEADAARAAFRAKIADGEAKFFGTNRESLDLDGAILAYGEAVKIFQDSSAAMTDRPIRDLYQLALVRLAMAHRSVAQSGQSRGRTLATREISDHEREANEAIGEVVRAFPDEPIPFSLGPDPEKLRKKVKAELDALPAGTLHVIAEGNAIIFVDEAFAGAHEVTLERPPGTYRILVKEGDGIGRVYTAVVEPGAAVEIRADATLDAFLHTSPAWFGAQFTTDAMRDEREPDVARYLAGQRGASAVVVLRFTTVNGRPRLVGVLYDRGGGSDRDASLALEPLPTVERRRSLAEYLAGDLDEWVDDPLEDLHATSSRTDLRWVRYPIAGVGVAAIATGVALVVNDGSCVGTHYLDQTCPKIWKTATGGYVAIGVGTALVGTALWMHFTGRRDEAEPSPTISVDGDSAMVLVRGQF